ncbi:unnamed protein product [Lymnaea stagnalis]|uniref:Cyclic nucleotide-binding domain-containing protein n=1 Tax=Lymnaea stagnalis TaxID=6523 RepID=A0AAV2ID23_LYMST
MRTPPDATRSPRTAAPRIQVTQAKVPELVSPSTGSKENLIRESPCSPPYRGRENPVFTFDSASLFNRAPSRVSEISPAFDIPFRGLPPVRRGSYFPFLPTENKNSLAVPSISAIVAAPRRSSFASSTSRDAGLNTVTGHGRRPKPLASLSIDDLTGGFGDPGAAIKSPGMLSTASMWSTSDLHIAAIAQKPEPDSVSHGGTNSLSNVSGSFSERMHELVRAFSGRTQRAKEKISQPPTPSSDSDYDAKSAISGTDEPQAPRNIRLGSFLPMGSRASDAFSDDNHDHFVGVWHCKFKTPKFLKRLRFPTTIEPHSKTYVTWLFLVALAFMYNAVVIPLRGVFPYQTDGNVRYWLIADYLCDLIYILDIVVFKNRLRFANNGIVETDRRATMRHYMQKWMFKFDIMSLTPLDLFYLIESVGVNPWLRLPRLLKIQTYWEFYERCDQASRSSAHAIRIIKTMAYMLFLIHIETCGYYAMSVHEGIGINDWVYDGNGIAYIRCFYLAAKTATSIGNNPTPTNEKEYVFMTFYWLSGVFVFALLIGQIRDIVEAAGMVKDNYRKKMDSCLWYMQSINLPKEMKDKVREWFLYNWEQQKTIDERSLVVSLPKKLQTDLAINVHFNTLSKVQLFQDCERNLLYDLVLKLKPILYLPGDYICQKGEVGKEMYIVTQGQVEVVGGENNNTVLATLHEGSVFGEISLLAMSGRGNRRTADVRCKGYTNVFTLSKHDFEMAMTEYPDAQAVLKKRAKKLLKANAKMEKKHKKVEAEEIIKTPPETPKLLQTVIQVMDPDSNVVKHLTPSIRRSKKNLKRPHSRSHSHRLSPTTSNVHHLTPPRSHSYRLANKTSCETLLDPGISLNRPVTPEKDGFDTDDENDEPMFDDSSDDVSLSEVLHDAGAISSFEDDDEDDILMTERYTKNEEGRKSSSEYTWRETSLSPMTDVTVMDRNNGRNNDRDSERNPNGNNGKMNRAKGEFTPNRNDSDSQRNDSHGLIGRKENGDYNLKGSNSKLYNDNGRGRNEQSNCEKPGNEGERANTKDSNGLCNSNKRNDRPLQHDDSMDDYIEKQRWQGKGDHKILVQSAQENRKIANSPPMPRMEKLAPPPLVMPSCSSASQDSSENGARQRKLSVVTPPLSPASPRDKIITPWVIGNNQTAAKRENGTGQSTRCGSMTPTENIPIRPLTPIETVVVKTPRMVDNTHHCLIRGQALTNGLEGCCGSGPLVDIPAENRITCAVEIHRQKSVNSSTTDIHGHTETML